MCIHNNHRVGLVVDELVEFDCNDCWNMRKFGENYASMTRKYGKNCNLCGKSAKKNKTKFCIDHDHVTMKVRGLLCFRCNLNISFVEKVIRKRLINHQVCTEKEILEYLLRGCR
jgi:hypothetical protein